MLRLASRDIFRTSALALALACALGGAACSDGDPPRDGGLTDLPLPDVWQPRLDQELPRDGSLTDAQLDQAGVGDSSAGVLTAPFFLDFEKSNGQLVGTRDWEWGALAFKAGTNCGTSTPDPPLAGRSGTGVWGTVLNDCYNPLDNAKDACTNADTSDDSVLTLKLKIPAHYTKAKLTYWEWRDFFLTFDWTEVRVNGSWVKQTCIGTNPAPASWQKQTLDLSAHVGQVVTVSFHFMASAVVNQSGWYLDDISASEF